MNGSQTLSSVITSAVTSIFNPASALIIALALVFFLYGMLKYIQSADNPTERGKASQLIWWGIIGLFVMVSVWGIVNIVKNSFDANYQSAPTVNKY